ncbi:hypothetical protein HYH03_015166 [Edaphochlamys debaryana]|uniref:Uncharacterized protein n=1 Tax=Edaphochlamys debaryana TaxID=47281 RepID=A0A836BSV0_9CHLO|nr:hypothetical protein HYH03_015166 [Edaphochlamys debaryana]|eukprot:KAG2486204.1 hypothetical protein HYH03_015166 [Edaphochlamys debaryana]
MGKLVKRSRVIVCSIPRLSTQGGWTPAHVAAFDGETEALQALIDAGASLGALTEEGETPLILAARQGHLGTSRELFVSGSAKIHLKDREDKTALDWARLKSHAPVVALLMAGLWAENPRR